MMTLNADPKQLIDEAETAYQTEEFALAAKKYQAAQDAYIQAGDALMAAEMANNASVSLLKSGDATAAFNAADKTDLVFSQAGDLRRQAIALSNQASALESLKKNDQALDLYTRSSDLLKQINETDMRAYVLKSISYLQFRTGKKFDAMATMRIALDAQRKLTLRERILKTLLGIVFRLMGT